MDELVDMDIFENEIKALEKKVIDHQNSDQLIAFYGSSSIRLWETIGEDLAPLNVINLGFGGSSFAWCIYYFQRVFKNLEPSQIVIYVGDNDLGRGIPPSKIVLKFQRLISMIRTSYRDIPIHYITIKPSPERDYLLQETFETNRLIRKETLKMNRGGMINVFDAMLDGHGRARPELYLDDLLHMNERGYKIWKGVVRKYFGV